METITAYFPTLNPHQLELFEKLGPLYREWNEKINVISRKDIDHLYEHHILHSLGIARLITFSPDAIILDLGTGGGFPGIPLAIKFPETSFTLIDGTRKKITVVQEIIQDLGLTNVKAQQIRAEEFKGKFDFVISRAVAPLEKLVPWSEPLIRKEQIHGLPNGLIALKGGNLKEEIKALGKQHYVEQFPMYDFFGLPYFEEKAIVYVQL